MLSINYNPIGQNSVNQIGQSQQGIQSVMQKLTSGSRLNSAADDVAGSSMASRMRVQSNSLQTSVDNAGMGVNLVSTMDSALKETEALLTRMTKLAEMSATGAYSTQDRQKMDQEFQSLLAELDRNAFSASYNGINLLNKEGDTGAKAVFDIDISGGITVAGAGSFDFDVEDGQGNTVSVSTAFVAGEKLTADEVISRINADIGVAGANAVASLNSQGQIVIENNDRGTDGTNPNNITVTASPVEFGTSTVAAGADGFSDTVISVGSSGNSYDNIFLRNYDMSIAGLGVSGLTLQDSTNIGATQSALSIALDKVTEARSHYGSAQTRMEYAQENLLQVKSATDNSLSKLQDTDYAAATMQLAQEKVKSQASQAMLSQSNSMAEEVVGLLR